MSSIGKRLKSARERKGLKQVDVKRRAMINNKTLSGYENGVSVPDYETLLTLADLYDVRVEWLITGENKEITNDQAKNDVMEKYSRLPHDKRKLIDDMIEALGQQN